MELIIIALALLLIFVIVYYFTTIFVSKSERLKIEGQLNKILPDLITANDEIALYTDFESGYFNSYKMLPWISTYKPTKSNLDLIKLKRIKVNPLHQEIIDTFNINITGIKNIREKYNKSYIEHELKENSKLFDDIEGRKLDDQQRRAVITDEDNNLVVAGAGSGKTTTIAGKVSYLINRHDVRPDEIVLISFTRKSSEEMRERIKQKMKIDIDVMTFHKLGKEIIAQNTTKQPSIFEEAKLAGELKKIFVGLMQDPDYNAAVVKFFTQYSKPIKNDEDFKDKGEYIQYMKDQNFRALKKVEVAIGNRRTLMNEIMKSIDEVLIANFLFVNSIRYEYEKKYEFDTADKRYAQYKPDFYLPDYGIYIEHFGIDRNGRVPEWFAPGENMTATQKYGSDIKWKRNLHKTHKTKLVETFHYEMKEQTLFSVLETRLREHGVIFTPKPAEEVLKIISESGSDDVNGFHQLVATFLNLFKSNNYSAKQFKELNNGTADGQIKSRNEIFLYLFKTILALYNDNLELAREIDFSDMINNATKIIQKTKSNLKYKYIIIDEFQDISFGRYHLIKALIDKSPGCRLFCVGDDWQSIYRFAGSDLSLFSQFENHFGVTELSRIETTYRFNSELIKMSGDFILKNPNQIKKELKAFVTNSNKPYQFIYSNSLQNNDTEAVIEALESIKVEIEPQSKPMRIMFLGRFSHDLQPIIDDRVNFTITKQGDKSVVINYKGLPDHPIDFLTVHKSKGLEADYVVLLNCNSGQWGFPSEKSDDPILNMVLTQADQFPNGEERRLFYVAITRCRKKVYMIAKSAYKSKFILELEKENGQANGKSCPECKNGKVIEYPGSTNGRDWIRYTCNNQQWGCDYLAWS